MESAKLSLLNLKTRASYFSNRIVEIESPAEEEIFRVLSLLRDDAEAVQYTVEFHKVGIEGCEAVDYCMQFQGEEERFVITIARNMRLFATPDFDAVLGKRGVIEVAGDEWSSARVCTDFGLALEIANEFCIRGSLFRPEIWFIIDKEGHSYL